HFLLQTWSFGRVSRSGRECRAPVESPFNKRSYREQFCGAGRNWLSRSTSISLSKLASIGGQGTLTSLGNSLAQRRMWSPEYVRPCEPIDSGNLRFGQNECKINCVLRLTKRELTVKGLTRQILKKYIHRK